MKGSSGAPCYDVDDFRLVAVHTMGSEESGPDAVNAAVPMSAIHADLTANGFDFELLADF